LGGNQWLSENTKLTWMSENKNSPDTEQPTRPEQKLSDPKHIMLTPMQIRTFVAEIIPNTA
jgi:hypothetical protein